MVRKRHSDEDILKLLREIEVHVHSGMDVVSACRKAGVSDKTYLHGARSLVEWGAYSSAR